MRWLVVCACVAACGEIGNLLSLQQQLTQEFGSAPVSVNVAPGQLTVLFRDAAVDSALEAKTARHVAEFVRDHYAGYANLRTVNVGFMSRRGAGPVSITNTRIAYSYRTVDLGPPVRADSAADSAPSVRK